MIGIREMTSVIVLGPISPLTSSYFIFLNIGAWGDVLFAKKILSCKKMRREKKILQYRIHYANVTQQWASKGFAGRDTLINRGGGWSLAWTGTFEEVAAPLRFPV